MIGQAIQRRTVRRRIAALLVAVSLAGCATTTPAPLSLDQQLKATRGVDQAWAADNQVIRADAGSRTVHATPDQAMRAGRAAMAKIGLDLDEKASSPTGLTALKTFKGGGWSWSPTVQAAEAQRLRDIFVRELGPRGERLQINPGDETLIGTMTRAGIGDGVTRVTSDFRMRSGVNCAGRACINEMPPTALRAAYYEFWTAFDEELGTIIAEDHAQARRRHGAGAAARPKPRAKPPSKWVLPPSGWTPPPK